jgi:transglutaminase-like putative cysteine protease
MILNFCKMLFLATVFLVASSSTPYALAQDESFPKSRSFGFHYGATIDDVPAGADVKVWIPISETNNEQEVQVVKTSSPTPIGFHRDDTYQNRIAFFQYKSTAQPISFSVDYLVDRREAGLDRAADKLTAAEAELFLKANSLVPVSGVPLRLLEKKTISSEPLEAGQTLYEVVENFMKYDKSKPGYGKGDVVWACDSRTGNCTDFHSLFISLARSRSIPAKFEIGFPIGPADYGKVNGYHCWAWFYAEGRGWMPVDISEADKQPELKDYYFGHLSTDRIAFTTGRDIKLVPESKSEPLNFFIYPHVEVDGKVWPLEKIKLAFSYQNQNTQQN